MKKWNILNESRIKNHELRVEELIKILLENRGLKSKKEIEGFLNPDLSQINYLSLGIEPTELLKTEKRINKAIKENEQIIVFGDYDVDGITGTAILWETLNNLHANVMPYIPHRIEEGYGLSIKGIENLLIQFPETKLIITVDNGIVASEAVEFANSLGLQVIITDHHTLGKSKPKAFAIVHSIKICGAGVAWFLSSVILNSFQDPDADPPAGGRHDKVINNHLDLVALATVADVMELKGFNRTLLIHGLIELHKTKRIGLNSLFEIAQVSKEEIGVYEIGHIIAPRLNSTGRMEHAIDSLRLICTTNKKRAEELAMSLNQVNQERQKVTFESFAHAKDEVGKTNKKLIFIGSEMYEPGVIGLISGRLTQEYYRPSIVASFGEVYSKASARSVSGVNIIEFIRLSSSLLIDAGGHPMAAGFTFETKKFDEIKSAFEKLAKKNIDRQLLIRKIKIDCELNLDLINQDLFDEIKKLAPFGNGNPEPTFLAKNVIIDDLRIVGKQGDHLKLKIKDKISNIAFNSIMFGYDKSLGLKIGGKIDIVYTISENVWNDNKKLELKIKDIKEARV